MILDHKFTNVNNQGISFERNKFVDSTKSIESFNSNNKCILCE